MSEQGLISELSDIFGGIFSVLLECKDDDYKIEGKVKELYDCLNRREYPNELLRKYSSSPVLQDCTFDIDGFIIAIKKEYLPFMKWLLSDKITCITILNIKYLSSIDIQKNYKKIICIACTIDNLEIVKYMIELDKKIDIHFMHEYAYRWSRNNNHLDIVEYLNEL